MRRRRNAWAVAFLCCIAIGIGSGSPIAGAETGTITTSRTIETSEFGAVDVTGPSGSAQGFVIVFSGDQGLSDDEREAVRALTGAGLAVCFYGIDDDEVSLCTSEDMRGAENIELPGDHHFDQRYAPIADRIMEGIAKRSGRP